MCEKWSDLNMLCSVHWDMMSHSEILTNIMVHWKLLTAVVDSHGAGNALWCQQHREQVSRAAGEDGQNAATWSEWRGNMVVNTAINVCSCYMQMHKHMLLCENFKISWCAEEIILSEYLHWFSFSLVSYLYFVVITTNECPVSYTHLTLPTIYSV